MLYCQAAVAVSDASQIGRVRREATQLAELAGLDESAAGQVSIIASELATNLSRYGQQGETLLRWFDVDGVVGVEILAIDRGPGMVNVARCLEDGFSTGGTPGNGLGAVRRLASEFDLYSTEPGGTVVFARVVGSGAQPQFKLGWGVVNRPAPHEIECGDTWRICRRNGQLSVMLADGLGHGPAAAESARLAATAFEDDGLSAPTDFLAMADRRLRGARGAAVAVAHIDIGPQQLRYAGVGNISGSLRSRQFTNSRGLVSHNGTVGVEMRRLQSFDYECPARALLIMHSDGLQSRWALEKYPGLIDRHPAVIAGVLYRDFCRGRDDVTVCVLRCPEGDS